MESIGALILKWAVPFICAGIVAFITYLLAKPKLIYKKGSEAQQLEEWNTLAGKSQMAKDMQCCKEKLGNIEAESKTSDAQILNSLTTLELSVNNINTKLDAQQHQIDHMREGVLDAHLQNLIETCKQYIARGYITPLEFDHYNTRLDVYYKLGGNGHMDNWNKLMMQLPKKEQ